MERWQPLLKRMKRSAAGVGGPGDVAASGGGPWRRGGNSFGEEEGNFEMVRVSYRSDTM